MSGAEVLPGGGIDSAVLMPPPSPPPPARNNVSEMNPDALGGFASQAARELEMKKEQLKLAMLELDLAERRERIANQQAERALKIKERELELAEREAKQRALLNPPPPPPPAPKAAPGLQVSDSMMVAIPPGKVQAKMASMKVSNEIGANVGDRQESPDDPPAVAATAADDDAAAAAAAAQPGEPPGDDDPADGELKGFDVGRNGDLAAKVAAMHGHKDSLRKDYEDKLGELDKQMAEAAIAQHKREVLASKVAAEAVREARTSRVSQLANLIAASLEMVKKSGDALDSVVLKLVDHIEQDTVEQMEGRPGASKGSGNDDVNAENGPSGMQDKLMKLMLSNPSDDQLQDAVAMMEGMKPKAEWDNMTSLTANLANLTGYMNRLEGKTTDEEDAQAIADRVLAEEAAANGEGPADGAADGATGDAPAAPADDGVEPATEADEVASEDLPVPKEMLEQLNVLRGKKKYLEEIKELEMAVRALQEEQAAGFPPEVEPPVLGDEGDEGDEGAGDAAPEPAAE
jgi:hypothetical protein